MKFDLGFGFWEGGRHAVAVPTRLIFERQISEVPYFPWGRWYYYVMQDGLIVTYPVKRHSTGNMAVMFLEQGFGLSRAFHDLREFQPFTPFQMLTRDPNCQAVCLAAAASIEQMEGEITPQEMIKMDEEIWCLQKDGWVLIRLKSMLAIGLDFPNGITAGEGQQGVVDFLYADQSYDPTHPLATPPVVS